MRLNGFNFALGELIQIMMITLIMTAVPKYFCTFWSSNLKNAVGEESTPKKNCTRHHILLVFDVDSYYIIIMELQIAGDGDSWRLQEGAPKRICNRFPLVWQLGFLGFVVEYLKLDGLTNARRHSTFFGLFSWIDPGRVWNSPVLMAKHGSGLIHQSKVA